MANKYKTGRHMLQIPGPTNVPDRVLRAMDFPTIDHRGEEFFSLAKKCLSGIKKFYRLSYTKFLNHLIYHPCILIDKL